MMLKDGMMTIVRTTRDRPKGTGLNDGLSVIGEYELSYRVPTGRNAEKL